MDTQIIVDRGSSRDALNHTTDTYVAHLLAQIDFLHNEIDRLESLLASSRTKGNKEHARTVEHYESLVVQKNAEVSTLRAKLSAKSDTDALARCSTLEKQLAAANSEKNVAIMEKNELKAKARKLEADLKSKTSLLKAQANSRTETSEEAEALQNDNSQLLGQLKQLADENRLLRTELHEEKERSTQEKRTVSIGVQAIDLSAITAVPMSTQTEKVVSFTCDKECQVDSVIHFTQTKEQSVFTLTQLLEEKTQECDSLRSTLEDMKAVQEDTLQMLDTTKKRLSEEVQNFQLSSDDTEKLTLQIRSLQQKLSKQTATERELLSRIALLEESRQQLQKEAIHIENEKRTWQTQIHQTESDIEQLVANKNYCNQQLSLMSNENENLRAEVQKLLQREAQLAFTLKAKDAELHEIIKAYQNASKENDVMNENQRFLERELDNIRATLASKEEGIIYLQEQLSSLHQREQQLVLDLQTYESKTIN
ncbi:BRCT domain-containing protein [Strigomonas culicis]|uniref:BRCT domain-containing protein n=1 Tax=Strigomonas culicis TaxID=28005 RepID=S9V6V0_9TRYP|nr:BRCT domain-containing protein [Strigomonas culicis]|eukprot:EPY18620.1 BRCT domain-containing protein [Strigomonas culicis]